MAKKQVTEAKAPKTTGNDQNVQWQAASSIIWKPEVGDVLIGTYDGSAQVDDDLKMIMAKPDEDKADVLKRSITMHYINIDEDGVQRRFSMIGGMVFDKVIESSPIEKGTLVRIEYMGQRSTKTGNRSNEFDVKYQ